MNLNDLTPEQQQLVNHNFGAELEKHAQEKVATVREMYQEGHDKIATQIADEYDQLMKLAEEEAKKEEEESKKEEEEEAGKSDEEKQASATMEATAAELGAFIERGTFDGLQKLGSERHGDPMFYLWPYIEEKVAEAGARAAVGKLLSSLSDKGRKAWGAARGGLSRAGKYHKGALKDVKQGVTGRPEGMHGSAGGMLRDLTGKERARSAAVGAAKLAPGAAGLAGLGYLATKDSK